jgi:hypothetical protein
MLSHNLQFHRTGGDDNIQVQEYVSDGEPADDVSVDSVSLNMPMPLSQMTACFPTTQDSFIVTGGASQDDDNIAGVGDDDESIVCQSQLLTDDVVMAQSCSTITYAMPKQGTSKLVEGAMKQNDASAKKVSVCGMMLRVTDLLRRNDSLASAGFDEAIEQYLHSFSARIPNLFPGQSVPDHAQAPASVPCNGRPTTKTLMSRTEAFRHPKNGASK